MPDGTTWVNGFDHTGDKISDYYDFLDKGPNPFVISLAGDDEILYHSVQDRSTASHSYGQDIRMAKASPSRRLGQRSGRPTEPC